MTGQISELQHARGRAVETVKSHKREFSSIVKREGLLPAGQRLPESDRKRLDELTKAIGEGDASVREWDARIERAQRAEEFDRGHEAAERPQAAQRRAQPRAEARARARDHETERSLVIGGMCRMIAAGNAFGMPAREASEQILGARHLVTEALAKRSLMAGVAPAGGFLVPPEYVAEMIELLRPMTVVRDAGPRVISMPRGTLQMPRQNQAASASYGGERTPIAVSQPGVGQVVASYKKLTAMTPITNDLLRYSDPAVDAMVRDDLTRVIARREDLAFIRGDGTQDSPKGFATFCLPSQKLTSTAAYSLLTVSQELGGALNKIETANVAMDRLIWIMHPRTKNYLLSVQNSNGFYVYREEMTASKTLLGWPFKTTTQIPTNLTVGGNSDCSEIQLVAMDEAMLFDSMQLELSVSREGTYVDAAGNLVSTFQSDQTLIRGISEHDFHMRHDEGIATITGVRWAPGLGGGGSSGGNPLTDSSGNVLTDSAGNALTDSPSPETST